MAPEVALGEGCVFPSDVLSFGTVCWEVITLGKAYEEIQGTDEFVTRVSKQGYRPTCRGIKSAPLKSLIKDCWAVSPDARPKFIDVCKTIELEIQRQQQEQEDELNSASIRHAWKRQARALKSRVQKQWTDYKIQQARRSSQT